MAAGEERSVLVKDVERTITYKFPKSFVPDEKKKEHLRDKELRQRITKVRAYRNPSVEIGDILEEAHQKVNGGYAKAAKKLLKNLKKPIRGTRKPPELDDAELTKELRALVKQAEGELSDGKLAEGAKLLEQAQKLVESKPFNLQHWAEYHAKKHRAANWLNTTVLNLSGDRQGCILFTTGYKATLYVQSGDDLLEVLLIFGKRTEPDVIKTLTWVAGTVAP